jgi:hypothetical protein
VRIAFMALSRLVVDYQIDASKPFATAIREIPSLPNLSYRIVQGDSLLEHLFGHVVQLDEMARDARTKQLIESIQADKQSYFREGSNTEKRRLELKIFGKQITLAERLIDEKARSLTGYQATIFGGEDAMTARDRRAKAEHEARLAELSDLKAKVSKAKGELERLGEHVGRQRPTDVGSLRRQLLRSGEFPTFMWRVDFAESFSEKGGFDIVVANPPYLSFGLRGNKAAGQEWGEAVRQMYPGSAEYKISVYALFLDLAVRLTARRGVVCYITPDSFLLGRYFSKLRSSILETSAVRKLVMFERDFWKSGVVGRPTVSLFQRAGENRPFLAVLCEDESSLASGRIRQCGYSQDYFRTVAYNRFRLFFSPVAKAYVETLERASVPLKKLARITTGVRSKSGQENVVASECRGPRWKKGIVSGG